MTTATPLLRRSCLLRNQSGVAALAFALCLLPLVGLMGLAIDYGNVLATRQQLHSAADAAALQAVTTARTYIMDHRNQAGYDAAKPLANAAGVKAFKANAGAAISAVTGNSVAVDTEVVPQGGLAVTITATTTYKAASSNVFAKLFGFNSFSFSGNSQASASMALYVSYYVLVDVSGSMGLPSTTGGMTALAGINTDSSHDYPQGCVFACHFPGNACQDSQGNWNKKPCVGYQYSRTGSATSTTHVANDYCPQPGLTNCIQLRIDAVTYALQQFMASAQAAETFPNQIGVGLYPFIRNIFQYYPIAAPGVTVSTDLTTASNTAACIPALLDTGANTNSGQSSTCANSANANVALGSGGTNFDDMAAETNGKGVFSQISAKIPNLSNNNTTVGDGQSQDAPKPIVFFITDGMQDAQTYTSANNFSGQGQTTESVISKATCQILTSRNISLYILYIPYVPIVGSYYNAYYPHTKPTLGEDYYADQTIPNIPASLQGCVAAATNYFVADPTDPTSITTQIKAMFAQSLLSTRLVQ